MNALGINIQMEDIMKEERYGAIQIIRDTLGGKGGLAKVSPNITWGRGVSKNVTLQFLLLISLVKVDKNLCHVKQGRQTVTKCHIGSKVSRIS